jgi:hypothetical protein
MNPQSAMSHRACVPAIALVLLGMTVTLAAQPEDEAAPDSPMSTTPGESAQPDRQPPEPSNDQPQPETAPASANESLVHWQYLMLLPWRDTDNKLLDFVLTPDVFDGARGDLADLRLYDAQDREVPYALRIREDAAAIEILETEIFDRSTLDSGARRLSLDLGEAAPEHNEVEIPLSDQQYRRRVVIEGSADNSTWQKLTEGLLVQLQIQGQQLRVSRIDYPPSRFRYLRLTVEPDPTREENAFEIGQPVVRRRVVVPGEYITRTVPFRERNAVPTYLGPGSRWRIPLGGQQVPASGLQIQVTNDDFVRNYQIEAGGPAEENASFYSADSGVWRRRAGEEPSPLVAQFSEVKVFELALIVTDNRNPPLDLTEVQVRAAARQVVFENDAQLVGPLRLYFGNPSATEPRYDFARNLPSRLDPAPTRLELQDRITNPVYQPVPPPLTERLPWLIYVILGTAIAGLAAVVADLAGALLKQHDSSQGKAKAEAAAQ